MSIATTPSSYGSDQNGLVCGYQFSRDGEGKVITADEAVIKLGRLGDDSGGNTSDEANEFIWLHYSLANSASERWLQRNLALPELFYETLREGSRSTREEFDDDQLVAVLNDVLFDFAFDASHISTLVLNVRPRLLVTARVKPLRSIDKLRESVKNGAKFQSTVELLTHLLHDQADVLVAIVRSSIAKVDEIEDQLLAGTIAQKRLNLSQLRRVLVRLKRLLAPEPALLFRLLSKPPAWISERDLTELRQSTEEFSVSISDIDTLQERVKLLQEQISAQVQEQNNHSPVCADYFYGAGAARQYDCRPVGNERGRHSACPRPARFLDHRGHCCDVHIGRGLVGVSAAY